MTATLADLVQRLQRDVPEYDGTPSAEQYEQAVADAVLHLSMQRPLQKTTMLNVVANQAEYTLPDDFLRLIELASPTATGGAYVTGEGIIPLGLGSHARECHEVAGLTLTIVPTPAFDHTRQLRYAAKHALVDGTYETLTDELAAAAMSYASYLALNMQASKTARDAFTFQDVALRVDKTKQSEAFRAAATGALARYHEAVAAIPVPGSPASFTAAERAYAEEHY